MQLSSKSCMKAGKMSPARSTGSFEADSCSTVATFFVWGGIFRVLCCLTGVSSSEDVDGVCVMGFRSGCDTVSGFGVVRLRLIVGCLPRPLLEVVVREGVFRELGRHVFDDKDCRLILVWFGCFGIAVRSVKVQKSVKDLVFKRQKH
jgi:hypothetical protein